MATKERRYYVALVSGEKKEITEVGLRKQRNTVVKEHSDILDLEAKKPVFQEWLPFLQNF